MTLRQLRAHGYSESQVRYRIRTGVWSRVHPNVVQVDPSRNGWSVDLAAAVLWSRGIASHQAAALLYAMPGCEPKALEVTTFDHRILSRCGIHVHHTNRMPRDQVTAASGLPCTTVDRTLLDLGAGLSSARVAIALDDALMRGLATLGSLDFCLYLTARRGRRGCRVLRELVKRRLDLFEVPNSPLESLIFEFMAETGLPLPVPQHRIIHKGRFVARADFAYPERRLAIEGHSRLWHSEPDQVKRDVARHERMVACGYRVVYLTWYDIWHSRDATVRRVESLLAGADGDSLPPAFCQDVRKEW